MDTTIKNEIQLFAHNQTAYESAVSMLAENGKAAIIHPTGTGKSFIGFKLAEDNLDKIICWLSPSEYIFKTQIENLIATGADAPVNVVFFTYARLMNMSEDELAEIEPDYIVLDEFHRCGAEMWGKGVQNLLNTYPDALLLGLSATNIRYLDNQRDMADELFDGNVASEMTLGEAIVRGILNPPTYVLSVYSYQKDLDKYKSRVKRAKSKAVRDAAERYLDALRRALDKADGIGEIFTKRITDKSSKFIVFCASVEHMDEMIKKVPEWFGKIDTAPHVYRAYSDDPETSKAFADFKEDEGDHLKLLFCIDMLNEGVHVENISGVILFRPTVSPIIYKQQIGRALSASKSKNAIIFDIVNNIENLYSISTIEQEMQVAITYYRFHGEEGEIVNERFKVIDEVRDSKRLFDELNDTLSASWDLMYRYATDYYDKYGNLEVERRYKTPDGYSLGNWIFTQRKVRAGEQYGNLDETRVAKLDAIGMVWDSYRELSWERYYAEAQKYYAEHADLNVNVKYVSDNGVRLGTWICNLRSMRKSKRNSVCLSEDRIASLDKIGMIWDQPDYLFESSYVAALDFYCENGHLDVPVSYVSKEGIRLGAWIRNIKLRRDTTLTQIQIDRLNEIGMLWDDKPTRQWNAGYAEAVVYYNATGNLDVPTMYVTATSYKLGAWLANQREQYKSGRIKAERKDKLDALGMVWVKEDSWMLRYMLAKAYFEEHGNLDIPHDFISNGVWLAKWLNEQRNIIIGKRKGKSLTEEQKKLLLSIGFTWKAKKDLAWDNNYMQAKSFYEEYGHLRVNEEASCKDFSALSRWIIVQRRYYNDGKLTQEQIDKLSAIGMIWCLDDPWEIGYTHAKEYFEQNGNLSISRGYRSSDGYSLFSWISNQRSKKNSPAQYRYLTDEQIKRLESIGMIWNVTSNTWETTYQLAFDYYHKNGDLNVDRKAKATLGTDLFSWLSLQRDKYWDRELSNEQIEKLNAIGFDWLTPTERKWESAFELARKYYMTYGNLDVPSTYKDETGFGVGMWVKRMRHCKSTLKRSGANGDQVKRLESIGMVWSDNATNGAQKNDSLLCDRDSVAVG